MVNTISPYFTDEDLESQLRMQFPYEQMYDMDFKTVFNQIEDIGSCYELRLRGFIFHIDKISGIVSKVE